MDNADIAKTSRERLQMEDIIITDETLWSSSFHDQSVTWVSQLVTVTVGNYFMKILS